MPMRYIKAGDIVEYDGGEYLVGEVLGNVVRLRNTARPTTVSSPSKR